MKILHTSDWHVGKTIRGRSRAHEHRAVLTEIAGLAGEHAVDLVLIPGDLFDTAAPSAESEQIVYRALMDLAATGAKVVAVSGNHDNARRLGAVAPLLDLTSVTVASGLRAPDRGGCIDVEVRSGETARIALVPFLSQRGIVKADDLMQLHGDEHGGKYAGRVRRIVEQLCASFGSETVNLIAAHLTVVGGTLGPIMGGGERAAHTIFDYHVSPNVFPSTAQYVALGHLHRPQKLAAAAPTWYSGSPLHLDFGEAAGDKAVLLIDATPGIPAKVEQLTLTSGRRLRTLTGTLEQLEAQKDTAGDDYLRIVVTEPPRAGLADAVRSVFEHAVDVRVEDPERVAADEAFDAESLRTSPTELFAAYLAEIGVEDSAAVGLFADLLEDEFLEEVSDATDAA